MKYLKSSIKAIALSAISLMLLAGMPGVLSADVTDIQLISKSDTVSAAKGVLLSVDTQNQYIADNITYSVAGADADKVEVDASGYVTIKPGYEPVLNDTVTVNASIDYYNVSDAMFYDGFEGEKKFTTNNARYNQSETMARSGLKAATPYNAGSNAAAQAPDTFTLPAAGKTTIVTAWYYDAGETPTGEHTTFGFTPANNQHIVVNSGNNDANWAANRTQYSVRTNPAGGRFYATNAARSQGWHKFQWFVTATGTTYKIDGETLSRQTTDGGAYSTAVTAAAAIGPLQLGTNWVNQNGGYVVANKHFIDDVSVIDADIAKATAQSSITLKLVEKEYAFDANGNFYTNVEDNFVVTVTPDLYNLASVSVNGAVFVKDVDYTVTGNQITVNKNAFISRNFEGDCTIVLDMGSAEISVPVSVGEIAARKYYFSNTGDDANDGLTPETAWASVSKINDLVFVPGSEIYLDAESIWTAQIKVRGNGTAEAPILLTKYNDGGNPNKRPIINGGGTLRSKQGFPLNGAIELFDVNHWTVSGLEVTNLGSRAGNGRSGIAVMTSITKKLQSQFDMKEYYEAHMEGIAIRDCYIHDVNGGNPAQNDPESTQNPPETHQKNAGGIIINGYIDAIVEECKTIRCDNEGIRNNAYGPLKANVGANNGEYLEWSTETGGEDAEKFAWGSEIVFRNNWIEGSDGDGLVLSGALNSVVERNHIEDCGYSYLSDKSGNLKPESERNTGTHLSTDNYAAAWIMGCKGAIFRYNESVDNPYMTRNDGMAWDIDMHSKNCLYEYNYSRNNYGGFFLLMKTASGNVARNNISINDGMSPGHPKLNKSLILFDTVSTDESISLLMYNNTFVTPLKDAATAIFYSGGSSQIYFQNNIFAYTGDLNQSEFKLAYTNTSNPRNVTFQGGRFTNNIFYPPNILGALNTPNAWFNDKVTNRDNVYVTKEELQSILKDYTAVPEGFLTDVGTPEADINFDALDAFRLADGDTIAYGKGTAIASPYITAVDALPHIGQKTDFYGNPAHGVISIGAHNPYQVTFDTQGGTAVTAKFSEYNKAIAAPQAPEKAGYTFLGWYTEDTFENEYNFSAPVTANKTLFAKWEANEYVLFTYDGETAAEIIPGETLTVDMKTALDDAAGKVMIVAAYDAGGKLLNVSSVLGTQNGTAAVFNAEIDLPATADNVKVFVWDADTFVPVMPAVTF